MENLNDIATLQNKLIYLDRKIRNGFDLNFGCTNQTLYGSDEVLEYGYRSNGYDIFSDEKYKYVIDNCAKQLFDMLMQDKEEIERKLEAYDNAPVILEQ